MPPFSQDIYTNKKRIISVLRENSPPDISDVDYTVRRSRKPFEPSLESDNLIFCDNIILWTIGRDKREEIYKKCKKSFGNAFKLVLLRSSHMKSSDIAPIGTSYFSFKVSLSEVSLEKILTALSNILSDEIIFHDIDITQDIPYITTRQDVQKYILENGIKKENIVNDLRKVGRNCISFYNDDHSVRIKVYNKFVQMLESCDVMTMLGSRIHAFFVDPTISMRNTLLSTKEVGMTRVEVKFYELNNLEYYINNFIKMRNNLEGCKFYKVSFEEQWRALVKSVVNSKVIMVYLKKERMFGYCHWYNSITNKMQGAIQKNVMKEQLMTLVANYSFNNMTTKVVIINNDEELIEEYKRVTEAITLIPGPRGGLYSNVEAKLSPETIGLTKCQGIQLGWINKNRKENIPIASIRKVSLNEWLEEITSFNIVSYRADYSVLSEDSIYRVIAKGILEYRDSAALVLEVENEEGKVIKLRCTRELDELMTDEEKKIYFRTGKLKKVRGCRSIQIIKEKEQEREVSRYHIEKRQKRVFQSIGSFFSPKNVSIEEESLTDDD